MIHTLINALALTPGTATSGASQHIHDLNTILNQVEKFYGQGWHSLERTNTIIFAVAAAFITVLGVVLGAFVPLYINREAEHRMARAIALAHRTIRKRTKADIERETIRLIQHTETKITDTANSLIEQNNERINAAVDKLTSATDAKIQSVKYLNAAIACQLRAAAHIDTIKNNPTKQSAILNAVLHSCLALNRYSVAGLPKQAEKMKAQATSTIPKLNSKTARILLEVLEARELIEPSAEPFKTHYHEVLNAIQQKAQAPV